MNSKLLSTAEVIDLLELFNEKAERLRQRNFMKEAFADGSGATLRYDGAKNILTTEKRGAQEESVDAFVLTLRFFLQPRDGISLAQFEQLYRELPIDKEIKDAVSESYAVLKTFLDGASSVEFVVNDQKLTNGKILESFVYGELAHANEEKAKQLGVWKKSLSWVLLQSRFEYIVGEVVGYIFWLESVNRSTIKHLAKKLASRNFVW